MKAAAWVGEVRMRVALVLVLDGCFVLYVTAAAPVWDCGGKSHLAVGYSGYT